MSIYVFSDFYKRLAGEVKCDRLGAGLCTKIYSRSSHHIISFKIVCDNKSAISRTLMNDVDVEGAQTRKIHPKYDNISNMYWSTISLRRTLPQNSGHLKSLRKVPPGSNKKLRGLSTITLWYVLLTISSLRRLGAHFRKDEHGSVGTEQDIDVAEIFTHENYHSPMTYSHDIALLRLKTPAKLGKGVGLVCMPDSKLPLPIDDMNKKCWITGWGRLASGGASPDKLMQVDVPLVSKARCLKGYPGQIHDSMLCAGLDQGGVDACQGDSGGPLVCEYNGKWYLEGATSWGYGCAAPNKYGVYAKVRYLSSWVKSKMSGVLPPKPTLPPTTPKLTPPKPTDPSKYTVTLWFVIITASRGIYEVAILLIFGITLE